MTNASSLRKELKERSLSMIMMKGDFIYESTGSGIKPIFDGLEKDPNFFKNAEVYDKIIGKAAAMLFVRSGVKKVYGEVMSEGAVHMFAQYGIECSFGQLAISIINRKGDDLCPMEKVVQDVDDLELAYQLLQERSRQLNS